MAQLTDLYFLIHGFCYARCALADPESLRDDSFQRYWQREQQCAERWRQGVESMGEDAALLIVPFSRAADGAAADFEQWAASLLGDRCFVLDCARAFDAPFWDHMDRDLTEGVVKDLRDALLGQGQDWHKEELDTALQCRGCTGQFTGLLRERDLGFDPRTVRAHAWGASFDGCVTKYSCNLRRLLGLSGAVEIDYNKTVPDAAFLLDSTWLGRFPVDSDLRLFVWQVGDQPVGLFTVTSESLADQPVRVHVPLDPETVTVLSKQGARLWPHPTEDKTPARGTGYYEPPQDRVVTCAEGLSLPVSHGMVWRLAKSPAYILGPPGTAAEAFRDLLLAARRA